MSRDILEPMIRQANRERRTDAWMQVAFGIIATVVAAVCILFFTVFAGFFVIPGQAWLVGLLATGIFLAAASWSAWHKIDPLQGITVDDFTPDGPWYEQGARGQVAAFASAIISGPRRLFEAWRSLRLVLPYDQDALAQIEDLLRRCQGEGLVQADIVHDQAYALARRLKLTKEAPGTDGAGDRLKLTDKGRAVLMP